MFSSSSTRIVTKSKRRRSRRCPPSPCPQTLFDDLAEERVVDVARLSIFELLAEQIEVQGRGNQVQRAKNTAELVFAARPGERLALNIGW